MSHCPTCTCKIKPRYKITPDLLAIVRKLYDEGGIDKVQHFMRRSKANGIQARRPCSC